MTGRIGSFPSYLIDSGLTEIIDALPEELHDYRIVDLCSGSGKAGLAAWDFYRKNTANEPALRLIDIDPAWFDKTIKKRRAHDTTLGSNCYEMGLHDVPETVNCIVTDLMYYLKYSKNEHGLALMRSALHFIEEDPRIVLGKINDSLSSDGYFVHACFCLPSEESKAFYDEITMELSAMGSKDIEKREISTVHKIEKVSSECFEKTELSKSYKLPADFKYVTERFGIDSSDDGRNKCFDVIISALEKYPSVINELNVDAGDDFSFDIPYYVMVCNKGK